MDLESAVEEFDKFLMKENLKARLAVNKNFYGSATPENRAMIEEDITQIEEQLSLLPQQEAILGSSYGRD